MKRTKAIIILFIVILLVACKQTHDSTTIIGIIEPLEHTAMNEIVSGFTHTLHNASQKPVMIKVENAQNDANLERAIIQKMRDGHYTIIVPIGTGATQMTLAMIHDKPIISLAANVNEADRKKFRPCHVAVVHDEISSERLIHFIHTIYPTLTQLVLVHSTADKVFPEVKETIVIAKKYGITITPMMASSLPELYGITQSLPKNTEGIFVLKDSLIVSGIATLSKEAAKRHTPLITSDQGSVQDGALFALGVHESDIGSEGAKLTAAILNGQSACNLPIVEMKKLTVFVNPQSLQKENQSLTSIKNAAKKLGYHIEMVNRKG